MIRDQHGNELPVWLLPARGYESRFTLGDLNVMREMGTTRVKALIAVIDELVLNAQTAAAHKVTP